MRFFKNPEIRSYLLWMLASLCLLCVMGLFFSWQIQRHTQAILADHDAAAVGALVQAHPEQELSIVRQFTKQPDPATLEAGRAVLAKYNYTSARPLSVPVSFWLYAGGCFVLFCTAGLVCLAKIFRKIRHITWYLQKAARDEPAAALLDCQEGDLGYLSNESVRVARTLYHDAERSRNERTALSRAISDISHQIKTPITSMTMLTDLLLEQPLDEAQRTVFLQRLTAQISRIKWLVDALLKLSKLDSGTITMERKTVSCQSLMEHCLLPLYPLMQQRQIRYQAKGQFNVCFTGDLFWMTEAVGNILKNCVEHTPPGGTVTVSAEGNPLYTELCIEDTGEGIDPEDLPHLFERFYRGKNASPDSVGIGLALSKSIIEKNGGIVDVKSRPGRGSRFSIRLYHGVV